MSKYIRKINEKLNFLYERKKMCINNNTSQYK